MSDRRAGGLPALVSRARIGAVPVSQNLARPAFPSLLGHGSNLVNGFEWAHGMTEGAHDHYRKLPLWKDRIPH